MEYKILNTLDKEWGEILKETKFADIYFTPEYSKIYEKNYSSEINNSFGGKSFLFFSGNKKDFLIVPLIKRKINDLDFIQDKKLPEYFDLISPYGYAGPIIKTTNESKEQIVNKFKTNFTEFCKKNNIVTEFTRFHPLIQNHAILQKKVDKRNTTVYLDLTKNEGTLLKEMNKKTRNLIRKAQKKGIQISISENKEDLKEFTKLYTKTMKRANASSKYFFPLKFFTNTFKYLKNNAKLFVAKYNGKIIASSIFLHKQDLLHYHFSGSDENYLNLAPNNLLLWEAAKWGKRMGCTKFHLGGGLSDNYDDSLFHFKSGFSNTLSKFYTVNVIHNNNVYKTLNILKNESKLKKDGVPINGNFFPKYRG